MEIVEGTIRYYPSLPYRIYNIHLPFGWTLFYDRDKWGCDVILFGSWKKVGLPEFPQRRKQLSLVYYRRWNTNYGRDWWAIVFGIHIMGRNIAKIWKQQMMA